MADLLKFLLLPLLLARGGSWEPAGPRPALIINQGAAIALLACWVWRRWREYSEVPKTFHRMLAHGAVGLAWVLAQSPWGSSCMKELPG
jgi:hypothetical protein